MTREQNPERLTHLSGVLADLLRARAALAAAERRAQSALTGSPVALQRGATLHEVIAAVLRANGSPMTSRELTDQIVGQNLYRQRNGNPLPISQTAARVRNYSRLFQIMPDKRIWLVSLDTP